MAMTVYFHRLRNDVVAMIRKAKQDYYTKVYGILSNKRTETKKWWLTLKHVCSWNTKKSISSIIENGTVLLNPVDKANALNDYFAAQWVTDDLSSPLPDVQGKTDQKLENFIIGEQEVHDLLTKLKVCKTGGPDGLPNKVLRLFAPYIYIPLTKLFNLSLNTSTFPNLWKEANVTALLKKDDPHCSKNYRPVSLLCSLSKVFEICVFKRLYEFLQPMIY